MTKRKPRRARAGDAKRAVAYLRQSTEDQALSADAQRASIERWASANGVTVVGETHDDGVSGAAPYVERPALMDALSLLRSKRAGVLVVAKRDRLARDFVQAAVIGREVEQAGAKVVTADGVTTEDTPEARMFRSMLDLFAQYERELIAARTSAALRAKRKRGELAGRVPYGYAAATKAKVAPGEKVPPRALSRDPKEWANVERIRDLHRSGLSLRKIAAALEAEGRRPRDGERWVLSTIAKIVKEG